MSRPVPVVERPFSFIRPHLTLLSCDSGKSVFTMRMVSPFCRKIGAEAICMDPSSARLFSMG